MSEIDEMLKLIIKELKEDEHKQLCWNIHNKYKEIYSEFEKYKKAYDMFMDYWDSFPEDQKKDMDEELKEIGL